MELHLSSCIQVNLIFQNGWHQKKTLQNDINIAWNNINISKHWGMTGIFDIKSVVQKTRALRSIDTQLTNHYKHWLWRIAVAIHLRSTEMWMETAPQPSDRGGLMRWRSGKCWKIHKPRKLRGISEILFYKGWGMNERESNSTFLKGKIRKKQGSVCKGNITKVQAWSVLYCSSWYGTMDVCMPKSFQTGKPCVDLAILQMISYSTNKNHKYLLGRFVFSIPI